MVKRKRSTRNLDGREYSRPTWCFNKLLFIEKEGFFDALKQERWPETYDCALLTSKVYATRSAKDLIDLLAEHDEPITVFCVHDADAAGTMIYQTLTEATRAEMQGQSRSWTLNSSRGKRRTWDLSPSPSSAGATSEPSQIM